MSRPIQQKLGREIEERGGEEYIFDQIASGVSIGKIAQSFGVSRRLLYRWRDERHAPHRPAMWADALKLSGEAHAEAGLDDLDKPGVLLGTEVQMITQRSKYRQWLAGKRDPQFAEKGIELNFNVGELHLRAVENAKQLGTVEAEVLEIEPGDLGALAPGDVVPSASEPAVETLASPAALPDELGELL